MLWFLVVPTWIVGNGLGRDVIFMVVDLTVGSFLRKLNLFDSPGRFTRQVARGRIIALAKTTDFFIQNLFLGRKNSLFSGIPISRSSPEWDEVGTD